MSSPSRVPPLDLSLILDVDVPFRGAVDEALLCRTIERVLRNEGVGGAVEVGLRITDDAEIQQLNARYRGHDRPTDVLSFPLEERPAAEGPAERVSAEAFVVPEGMPRQLGDIVISFPRAREQATTYGHSLERELAYLTAHGTLHLMGYDHEDEAERRVMRAKEEAALPDLPR